VIDALDDVEDGAEEVIDGPNEVGDGRSGGECWISARIPAHAVARHPELLLP
jgi:hypothetical protein